MPLHFLPLACVLCLASDTPPARMVPAPMISQLNDASDVIAASRRADGSNVSEHTTLPVLENRTDLLSYIRRHYPENAPGVVTMPIIWVYIDEVGTPYPMRVIRSTGHHGLDSLAFAVVARARFTPAYIRHAPIGNTPIALWVPLPVSMKSVTYEYPSFTPYTTKPELLNREAVQIAMVRNYPRALRDAGKSGTVVMWVLLNEHGEVEDARVKTTSGLPQLDQAAHNVAHVMRFSPALNGTVPVKVWIQLPIVFKAPANK